MLNRRVFLATGLGATLAAPGALVARQAEKIHRIGWRTPLGTLNSRQWFLEAMREKGWIEGQDFTVEFRHAPPTGAEMVAAEGASVTPDCPLPRGAREALAIAGANRKRGSVSQRPRQCTGWTCWLRGRGGSDHATWSHH